MSLFLWTDNESYWFTDETKNRFKVGITATNRNETYQTLEIQI